MLLQSVKSYMYFVYSQIFSTAKQKCTHPPAPSNILLILDSSNLDHLQLVKGKDTELFKSKSVNTHIMLYQLLMHKSLT